MKAYIEDRNNVLLEVSNRVQTVSDPKDADVLLTWQDVRGSLRELAEINQNYLHKPLVVVQHGRGATRDYLEPNNFKLLADKICVWGEAEAERMDKAGYSDRVVITGSPLTYYTRKAEKKTENDNRIVLFLPVITDKEEPDNIATFYTLKQIEYKYATAKVNQHYKELKALWKAWQIDEKCATESNIPYDLFRQDFFLMAKLTDIHDNQLYHGPQVRNSVCHATHLENMVKLLVNTSCLVGMEEGTAHLMAAALGIPSVIVDGFKYAGYGGVKDYNPEVIRTDATAFCQLSDIEETILHEINNKFERQTQREEVVRREFDPYPEKDPIELIIDTASELCGGDIRLEKIKCH